MKVLDLFSGIGGFSLGLERAGMETVAFCEFDKKAQLVLKKHWPDVPIYDDVRELTYGRLKEDGIVVPLSTGDGLYTQEQGSVPQNKRQAKTREDAVQAGRPPSSDGKNGEEEGRQFKGQSIELICGGFPCQPFSQAGKRKGEEDDRHLWPEYFRLIQEIRPRWVIGENVAGLINLGLDQVLSDLESAGYRHETLVIPACAVNAPHRRDRVWIIGRKRDVADSDNGFELRENNEIQTGGNTVAIGSQDVADSECKRQSGQGKPIRPDNTKTDKVGEASGLNNGGERSNTNWDIEPDVGRVAHGIPNRVDRLKQLGNAVVPQVVEQIGRAIMKIERE